MKQTMVLFYGKNKKKDTLYSEVWKMLTGNTNDKS